MSMEMRGEDFEKGGMCESSLKQDTRKFRGLRGYRGAVVLW